MNYREPRASYHRGELKDRRSDDFQPMERHICRQALIRAGFAPRFEGFQRRLRTENVTPLKIAARLNLADAYVLEFGESKEGIAERMRETSREIEIQIDKLLRLTGEK
jgi:hypothetical protein